MIRVQILNAENLPVPTKNERKTKIFCFSTSSCNYFYNSFKNDENTRNPKWNESFDVDLFRCSILTFKLYSSRLFSKNIFLGDLNIDFSKFLTQSPGNQILKQPYGNIRCEFPLTSYISTNAKLYLSFLYIPKIYPQIQIKDVSNTIIHLWATYTPSIEGNDNCIEIELLQLTLSKDKKNKDGFFFNLNNHHSWESVGYSSSSLTVLESTGFTPIRSFFLDRISNTFNFFIVNVSNFSGTVTLNFISEKRGDPDSFDKKFYISPKIDKKNSIGTVKTVDIKVEPNKKYCAPVYLFYEKKLINSTFAINNFQQISTDYNQSKSEIIDQLCSEIPFQSSIAEVACCEIAKLNGTHIMKTFVLPENETVSIQKVLDEFGLQKKSKIRIYLNGSTTISTGQNSHTDFWRPYFIIFDLSSGQTCPEISKKLSQKPLFNFLPLFEKNTLPFEWHTFIDLDLDEIGTDKIIVLSIGCLSYLNSANSPGMVIITQVEGENETILFRNPVYVDDYKTFWTTFMRIEYVDDCWNLTQMRYTFNRKRKLEIGVNALFKYNWEMPEKLFDEPSCTTTGLGSSDEEFLLNEI